ncbi:MAG: ABC transporter permease [Candidatus Acidiferrales bacterium]
MMLAGDTLRLAFDALRAHKLRTALTLLGLVIGVTSLILVMTLIQGANWYVETKIANLGADIFQVSKLPIVSVDFNELIKARKHRDITVEDWRAVENGCSLCRAVGAEVNTMGRVSTAGESLPDVSIRGQTANMAWISSLEVEQGRFFTDGEQRVAAPVVVLGYGVAERLFPQGRNPLGQAMRIAGEEFRVTGVSEEVGSILGQDQDKFVMIPIDSFFKLFGLRHSLILQVQVPSAETGLTPAQDQVRALLRARRHVAPSAADDFYFTTAETYLSLWSDISSVFFLVFVLISSVASLVGGIVIMNITLVSVSERKKEIGLRRSVGATQADIAGQFLVEVLAQCLVGGLTGVLLGFACALLLRQLTPFPADVELWVAALGLGLASLIAITFGLYPAYRAAKLDPVVALRSD